MTIKLLVILCLLCTVNSQQSLSQSLTTKADKYWHDLTYSLADRITIAIQQYISVHKEQMMLSATGGNRQQYINLLNRNINYAGSMSNVIKNDIATVISQRFNITTDVQTVGNTVFSSVLLTW